MAAPHGDLRDSQSPFIVCRRRTRLCPRGSSTEPKAGPLPPCNMLQREARGSQLGFLVRGSRAGILAQPFTSP